MQQDIKFCTASDGVRIGYAVTGDGPPVVKVANYLTHLEHDWNNPVWHHWFRELSSQNRFVRYDARGSGLSDWDVEEFNMNVWVRDLEAVVSALDLERFVLLGISQGASVSIAYASKHPEKVSRLIIYGGYARGKFNRSDSPENREEAETMINLIRVGWGQENPAFRQVFTTLLIPEGDDRQFDALNELARISATPGTAAQMERAFYHIDVADLARQVQVPALVMHSTHDSTIPFEEGELLASLIPDTRWVPLESKNHILLEGEPAWRRFVAEFHSFLGPEMTDKNHYEIADVFPDLTPREVEVLGLIARGLNNGEIANHLYISPKTVRNHITHIFDKLQVDSRAKAIVLAREAGLGHKDS